MALTIRPFTDADYGIMAEIVSLVNEERITAESFRWQDQQREAKYLNGRWVAEVDGRVVGGGDYDQQPASYHPQKFDLNLIVHPEFRRRGIGTALYEQIMAALRPHDPIALYGWTKENWPDSLAFLAKFGWEEKMRLWESQLHLPSFDPAPFAPVIEEASAKGYLIKSFAELKAEEPEAAQKVHAMVMEVRRDVPSPTPWQETPFESWLKYLESPHFLPEGYLIGMKDGEMVGISALWKTDDPTILSTGLTGVKRAHRGSGIAKAMKVRAATVAREMGYTLVKTWNETNNQRMLAINAWLGFARRPAAIAFSRQIRPE